MPRRLVLLAGAGLVALTACTSSPRSVGAGGTVLSSSGRPSPTASATTGDTATSATAAPSVSPAASLSPVASATPTPSAPPTVRPSPTATPKPATPAPANPGVTVPAGTGPVIVIDPGHSPTINAIDPATGLNVSDYENEPEMHDVFAVAQQVKAQLTAAGYRVVMTKNSVTDRVSLAQRAAIANQAHAALAISIHDQAGASDGIPFASGNNVVYYQAVGDYRATPAGKRVYFTDAELAATSQRYGAVFQSQRRAIEGHNVSLQGNVGYDLGSRGLAAGNIWIVQLLSTVPWVYNEAGGNSAGTVGLNAADQAKYAAALVASIEACVPA